MEKAERIVIFGNGRLLVYYVRQIRKSDYIIGVDRAAYWLITHGVVPNVAIGDFDSVSEKEFKFIKSRVPRVLSYPAEKDATDMELAVDHALTLKPKEIFIYGGFGTRQDHTLANLHLLWKCHEQRIRAYLIDSRNLVYLLSGTDMISPTTIYRYFSIIPYTSLLTVTLSGFKYDVLRKSIMRQETIGVSNELKAQSATVTIHMGIAVVIRSRDT